MAIWVTLKKDQENEDKEKKKEKEKSEKEGEEDEDREGKHTEEELEKEVEELRKTIMDEDVEEVDMAFNKHFYILTKILNKISN